MQLFDFRRRGAALQGGAVAIGTITTLAALGIFAYLGTFTRYLADDYCEMMRVTSGNIIRALIWRVVGDRRLLGRQWPLLGDILAGSMLAFFPISEAPNRFQTIYWRSGMATHFAPLVYLTAFAALLLMLIRRNEGRRPALWIGPVLLVLAFFGGGFSEPPDAML